VAPERRKRKERKKKRKKSTGVFFSFDFKRDPKKRRRETKDEKIPTQTVK